MSASQETQLSALIDGEVAGHHRLSLYGALGRDPQLCATWERYHLIGQVLRGEPVSREVRAVAAAVRADTAAAPPGPPPRARMARWPRWRPPFAGAALAATAAFLAVFAVPGLYREPAPRRAPPAALAGGGPPVPAAVRRWDTDRPELVSTLDRFLVNHQEAAPASGARGILPYATLVGYAAPR